MPKSYTWKKTESKIAKVFDTKRTMFSGSNSGISSSDTLHNKIYVECKTKEKHSVKTLFDETKKKAKLEGKIPVIILKENNSDDVLWVFEQNDIFNILKEIDLNSINKDIPVGTTINKLLTVGESGSYLYDLKKLLEENLQAVLRNKILSPSIIESARSISFALYCIDFITNFKSN